MKVRVIQFAAAILTALALVPGGAHVLELSNKINLDQAQYVAVQQIYRGWALLGIVLIAALLANLLSAIVARSQKMPVLFAATATVLLGVTLAVFFTWTFPVNRVTDNWTVAPADWEATSRQVGVFACDKCCVDLPRAVLSRGCGIDVARVARLSSSAAGRARARRYTTGSGWC